MLAEREKTLRAKQKAFDRLGPAPVAGNLLAPQEGRVKQFEAAHSWHDQISQHDLGMIFEDEI